MSALRVWKDCNSWLKNRRPIIADLKQFREIVEGLLAKQVKTYRLAIRAQLFCFARENRYPFVRDFYP